MSGSEYGETTGTPSETPAETVPAVIVSPTGNSRGALEKGDEHLVLRTGIPLSDEAINALRGLGVDHVRTGADGLTNVLVITSTIKKLSLEQIRELFVVSLEPVQPKVKS